MIIYGPATTPDNQPIVGSNNLITSSNLTADSENASFPIVNASNANQDLRWESLSADEQYVTAPFDTTSTVNYVGIVGHNFGDSGALVSVEVLQSAVWNEMTSPIAVTDNSPLIFKFENEMADGVRLRIQASVLFVPTITTIYAGQTLQLERRIYVGHTPLDYGRTSDVINGLSENGQFIGRIVIGETFQSNVTMENITPAFFRNEIQPFFEQAVETPFFFAWRPLQYNDEVGFAWLNQQNGTMQNQLPNGMVSIAFPIQGTVLSKSITTAQPTERIINITEDVNNLNLRTLYDSLFPAPTDETILTVNVDAGVVIGSTSTASPAFDVGTWPSGTTINMNLDGKIQGAGGDGGDAPNGDGNDGGDAMTAARAITVDLAGGGEIIDGAGGGGASTDGGGGGGAGTVPGSGGSGTTPGNDGTETTGGAGGDGDAGSGGNEGLIGEDSNLSASEGGDSGCTIDDNPLITVINQGSGTIEGCNINPPSGADTIDITTDEVDYNLRTEYDLLFPVPDASTVVDVFLRNGVTVSSSDPSIPAFDIGSWPVGATINLNINGTIKGAGGDGGDGGDSSFGNDENTVLLLNCDGTDGSTSFPDSSIGGTTHTMTANGTAQVDTAQQKFGTGSLLLDGDSDWLSTPDDTDFDFGFDFTVDFWARFASLPASNVGVAGQWNSGVAGSAWQIIVASGVPEIWWYDNAFESQTGTTNLVVDTWYHFALVYEAKAQTVKLYLDGVLEATVSSIDAPGAATVDLMFGRRNTTPGYMDGWLDEIRISNIARWTANFTPPTEAYFTASGFDGEDGGDALVTTHPITIDFIDQGLGADGVIASGGGGGQGTLVNGAGGGAGDIFGVGGAASEIILDGDHPPGPDRGANFTHVDRTWQIPNSVEVTKIGVFSQNAGSVTVKICLENSSTNYDIEVSETFTHDGNGWQDFELSSSFNVPATGVYRVGNYSTLARVGTNISVARSFVNSNATGNGVSFTADTNATPITRVLYDPGQAGTDGTGTTGGTGGSGFSKVSQSEGTIIGDMTFRGGNAAAFNGDSNLEYTEAARGAVSTPQAYVGKDWGSGTPKTITGFRVWSSLYSSVAAVFSFVTGSGLLTDITLKGSDDPPTAWDGAGFGGNIIHEETDIDPGAATDGNQTFVEVLGGFSGAAASYRYNWVEGKRSDGNTSSNEIYFAEVEFYVSENAGDGGDLGQPGFPANSTEQGGAGAGAAGFSIDGIDDVTFANRDDGTITGPANGYTTATDNFTDQSGVDIPGSTNAVYDSDADQYTNTVETLVSSGQTYDQETEFGPTTGADKMFDEDPLTLYQSGAQDTGWVEVQFTSGGDRNVTRFDLTARNNSDADRVPSTWNLQASDTGAFGGEETTLFSITDDPLYAPSETKRFDFTNGTAYEYYRMNFSDKQGDFGKNAEYVIAEGAMYEVVVGTYTVLGLAGTYTAASAPDIGKIEIGVQLNEAATANTDFFADLSRDGGTTFEEAVLTEVRTEGDITYFAMEGIDLSAQPSDTDMVWRFRMATAKRVNLDNVTLGWNT